MRVHTELAKPNASPEQARKPSNQHWTHVDLCAQIEREGPAVDLCDFRMAWDPRWHWCALRRAWPSKRVWLNPPFSQARIFLEKALSELHRGVPSVLLLPTRSATSFLELEHVREPYRVLGLIQIEPLSPQIRFSGLPTPILSGVSLIQFGFN
jgi:hypothetical protein